MCGNAIEHLNGNQPDIEGGSNCEHRAIIFRRVNVSIMMIVIVGGVVIVIPFETV